MQRRGLILQGGHHRLGQSLEPGGTGREVLEPRDERLFGRTRGFKLRCSLGQTLEAGTEKGYDPRPPRNEQRVAEITSGSSTSDEAAVRRARGGRR
jgi:hypothetical protein